MDPPTEPRPPVRSRAGRTLAAALVLVFLLAGCARQGAQQTGGVWDRSAWNQATWQ